MIPGRPPARPGEEEDGPLNVDVETVSKIIARTREVYAGMPPIDEDGDTGEESGEESGFREIAAIIDELNEDEKVDLVALMWIGRGTYGIDEMEHARRTARVEATHTTSDYLLSTPLIADYLADGLEAFGIPVEED